MKTLPILLLATVLAQAKKNYLTGRVSLGFEDFDLPDEIGEAANEEYVELVTPARIETATARVGFYSAPNPDIIERVQPTLKPISIAPVTVTPSLIQTPQPTTMKTTTIPPLPPPDSVAEATTDDTGESGLLPSQKSAPPFGFSASGGGGLSFGAGNAPTFPGDDVPFSWDSDSAPTAAGVKIARINSTTTEAAPVVSKSTASTSKSNESSEREARLRRKLERQRRRERIRLERERLRQEHERLQKTLRIPGVETEEERIERLRQQQEEVRRRIAEKLGEIGRPVTQESSAELAPQPIPTFRIGANANSMEELLEDQRQIEEEQRKRMLEERKRREEEERAEETRREELRMKELEEERRKEIEAERREKEKKQRELEDEQRRDQELREKEEKLLREEERKREEEKRRLEEQRRQEEKRREEEERRKEEERLRKEEEERKQEEQRRLEEERHLQELKEMEEKKQREAEERRKEEERIRKEEEEERRKEKLRLEELERRHQELLREEEKRQEELKRQKEEEERKQREEEEKEKKRKEEEERIQEEEEERKRAERRKSRLERLRNGHLSRSREKSYEHSFEHEELYRTAAAYQAKHLHSTQERKEQLLREKERLEQQLRSLEKHENLESDKSIEIEVEKLRKSKNRAQGVKSSPRQTKDTELPKTEDKNADLLPVIVENEVPLRVQPNKLTRKILNVPPHHIPAPRVPPAQGSLLIRPLNPSSRPVLPIVPVTSTPFIPATTAAPFPITVDKDGDAMQEYLKAYYRQYYQEWYRTHNEASTVSPVSQTYAPDSSFLGVIPAGPAPIQGIPNGFPMAGGIFDPRINGQTGLTKEQLDKMCVDIKGTTRAFGIKDPKSFAEKNCSLIRMYYKQVTCDQIVHVMEYCAPVLNS